MGMREERHEYREVLPDETLYDFEVGATAPERLRLKIQAMLVEALRQAGVCTIMPVSGDGYLLLEEEGLRRALNVHDDEAFNACVAKTIERKELHAGSLRNTFWTEADLMRSGLLWAGDSSIQEQIVRTLSETLVPVAVSLVVEHRNAPAEAVVGDLSALEEVEMLAIVEQLANAILPGCEGLMVGGDGTEQGELFADEDEA
jgi:hypothetical protein